MRHKTAFERIPRLVAWLFFGYLVVVNSEYSAVKYADYPGMEHFTLNTLRLGYAIVGGAIFDFIFLTIRDRKYLQAIALNEAALYSKHMEEAE